MSASPPDFGRMVATQRTGASGHQPTWWPAGVVCSTGRRRVTMTLQGSFTLPACSALISSRASLVALIARARLGASFVTPTGNGLRDFGIAVDRHVVANE
jgi:hypothetical protein